MTDGKKEIVITISGQNGDGIFSQGETLSKICSRSGLHIHSSRTYQSVIRGGHVSYTVRASNDKVQAPPDFIDLLIAIRPDSFVVDAMPHMRAGGYVLYDSVGARIRNPQVPDGVKLIDIPAVQMARDIDPSIKQLANTVYVGAAIALYQLEFRLLENMLDDTFKSKGEQVVATNVNAAKAGFNWAKQNAEPIPHQVKFDTTKKSIFIGGNEALALGMLNGGLQSYAWYPMTPATPVGAFLAQYGPEAGCVVKQMEDEVNVANFAIGAAYAGARSACGTSGGGFALMTEAIGFASMIEAPVVYIEVARGGPSTGLPTKTEQGDLNQLLGASQGDYPKAVIAQVSVEDGFYLGQESLNIAEKYQIPVLIATDLYMGEHFETLENLDWNRIPIQRGKLILDDMDGNPYKRYEYTDDGISPRTIPGVLGGNHDAGSDEHDDEGKLISDIRAGYPEAINHRNKMMHKRMKKLDGLIKELPAPKVDGYTADKADVLLVSWGSTLHTIKEARVQIEALGKKTAQLHIKYIHPFHSKEVLQILNEYKAKGVKIIMIEGNYTGQMARLIASETGFIIQDKYLRFDGEYILPHEIRDAIMKMI